ncbi:DUF1648 domain-containing protein [Chloroflexota bacterium]
MIVAFLIIATIIVLGMSGVVWLIYYMRRLSPAGEATAPAETRLPFRWSYIVLPLTLLCLFIALSAYFYHLLPTEVATHFELDGTPDDFSSRGVALVWAILPQLLFTLLAAGITAGLTRMTTLLNSVEGAGIRPERVLLFLGNAMAVPQLILGLAIADVFSYNAYQQHLMPMWLFLAIVFGLSTVALALVFTLALVNMSKQKTKE